MTTITKEQAVLLALQANIKSPDLFKLTIGPATIDTLLIFAKSCFELGRNAGLEQAKQVCLNELNDIHSSNESRNTAEHLADAIESLKDNTP